MSDIFVIHSNAEDTVNDYVNPAAFRTLLDAMEEAHVIYDFESPFQAIRSGVWQAWLNRHHNHVVIITRVRLI